MARPEISPEGRIIVALDMPERRRAMELAMRLYPRIGAFKVGPALFLDSGPSVVGELVDRGARVFLDLKFHDIPSTVESAVERVCRLGVGMFTVHALGGLDMMKRAAERVRELSPADPGRWPLVLAVTVLTSHDEGGLRGMGVGGSVEDQVLRLAALADRAGVDGVVASGREARSLRREFGDRFLIVVPGIRLGSGSHDQKRVSTPRDAVRRGADYLVIGRALTEAPEPERAIDEIVSDLRG